MVKQVSWSKIVVETFLEESGINDRIKLNDERAILLERILRTRVAGYSQVKQAEIFHISIDTVKRYVRELKDLYDETQKYSVILPMRRNFTKWEKQEAKEEGKY